MAAIKKSAKIKFAPLGKVLFKSFKSLGIDLKIAQQKVMDKWLEIVGEPIDTISKPHYFKFRTLFVNVSNPIWLHQLVFMEDQIKEKINKSMGRKLVQKIYFQAGEVPVNKARKPLKKEDDSHINFSDFTNKNDEKEAERALDTLKDTDLKQLLKRIMMKGKGAEMFRQLSKKPGSFGSHKTI